MSIANLAREVSVLWETANNMVPSEEIEARHDAMTRRIYAIEDLLAESRATSAADAFALIIQAAGRLNVVNNFVWCKCGEDEEDRALRAHAEKAERMLHSAIAALEMALDFDRDAYAGEALAPRRLDPHEAEKAAPVA